MPLFFFRELHSEDFRFFFRAKKQAIDSLFKPVTDASSKNDPVFILVFSIAIRFLYLFVSDYKFF